VKVNRTPKPFDWQIAKDPWLESKTHLKLPEVGINREDYDLSAPNPNVL